MTCESSTSAEFRVHIHHLLNEYSLTHYTTNYIEFTEDLVGEFVENLAKIPLVDRYSLTRLPDPFDVLCQINSFSTLSPYDELPRTTQDAVQYLKNVSKLLHGVPPTDKAVQQDDYGPPSPREPCMPALTRKARQNTPRPGKISHALPDTHARLLSTQNVEALGVEPVEEKKIIPEDLLDARYQVKPEELPEVQALLKTTVSMARSRTDYKNRYLQPEYLDTMPLPEPFQPEEFLLPIFTRDRHPRSGVKDTNPAAKLCNEGFKSFSEIPVIALKKIDTSDLEVSISKQNLVVVDGWETIKSSPPSTPESSQSDEDKVDQLLLPSSPDSEPPLITEFLQAKLEPIMMPRSRRIGGNSGISPHILAGKSSSSFLKPLLSPIVLQSEKREDAEPRRQISPVPSSMVGEADTENESATAPTDEQNLDAQIKALYTGHPLENIILAESIDDKPSMMMTVPDLPGPNLHLPNAMYIPRSGSGFLVPKRADDQQPLKKSSLPMHQFLSKAKGISPLYTSLSWVMFKTDKQLPSNEEAIGVDKLLGDKTSTGCSDTSLQEINALIETLSISEEERLPRWDDDDLDCFQHHQVHDDFHILQTREERWRLARLEGRLADVTEEEDAIESLPEEPTVEDDISDYDERLENDRPAKRPRLEDKKVCDPDDIPSAECSSCLPPHNDRGMRLAGTPDNAQAPLFGPPAESDQARLNIVIDSGDKVVDSVIDSAPLDDNMHCGNDDDFIDDFEENKENWPPSTSSLPAIADGESSDYHTPEHMRRHYLVSQYDMDDPFSQCYPDSTNAEGGGFQPLSFGKTQPDPDALLDDEWVPTEEQDAPCDDAEQGLPEETNKGIEIRAHPDSTRQQPDKTLDFRFSVEPSMASHSLGISAFAQLRARQVSSVSEISAPQTGPCLGLETEPTRPGATRADVIDQNTIQLPRIIKCASSVHRYMASVDFIQKNALVRALSSSECAIELAERPSLAGVDLVLDPSSAVIVLSLFTLAARCESHTARVAQESWRYAALLVVFEAYPAQLSRRASRTRWGVDSSAAPSELCAYTPPIAKAVKKFRRDLDIAEACGTKDPRCSVRYAFADTVNEAALFVRFFGDRVEAEDETQGALWGEREWLSVGAEEADEARLAGIVGMNLFKAAIILCQVTLQEYIDMSAQERIDAFAPYVGMDTMVSCNAYLEARLQEVHSESNVDEPGVAGNEDES